MPWLAPMLSVKTERDHGDPCGEAQPRHDGRHGEGHDDPPDKLPSLHAETASGLDHAAVHVAHAVERVEVHGEQGGQGDEVHVGGLADAEPDDEQEDQGRVGHGAQHLQRRIEELLAQSVEAHDDAEDQPDPGAQGEALEGALDGDPDVAQQVLVQQQLHERVPGGSRGPTAPWAL